MGKNKTPIVRIKKIQIKNLKNVENGCVEFKNNIVENDITNESEILGIYGQNGSGKTTLVDASSFLKMIFSEIPFPNDVNNYINLYEKKAEINIEFYIKKENNLYLTEYSVILEKSESDAYISYERLSYSKYVDGKWKMKKMIFEYDSQEEVLLPKLKYEKVFDEQTYIKFRIEAGIAIKQRLSILFCTRTRKFIEDEINKDKDFKNILDAIIYFARCNWFVIPNNHNAIISMNVMMPFSFRIEGEKEITSGDIGIVLNEQSNIPVKQFKLVKNIINQMNIVLKSILPEVEIDLYEYGDELDKNGNLTKRVELISLKADKKLPVRYESEGIKKIISILSALIAMYNNESICMIVDELDSGIYEYLLGEILKVIDLNGKGQLLFTSHNLRPLEILDKGSIYFTTINSQKRYVHFYNVKPTNNLRSLYLRNINLGGQKEILYDYTDEYEIRRAFRLAGDMK